MNGATRKLTSNGPTVFATCSWPPRELADPDGYFAITVDTEYLADGSEATNDSEAARVTGPCAAYELTFTYNHMGLVEHTDPTTLTAGARVIYPSLRTWERALPFDPGSTELVVVHAERYQVDQVTCAGPDTRRKVSGSPPGDTSITRSPEPGLRSIPRPAPFHPGRVNLSGPDGPPPPCQ